MDSWFRIAIAKLLFPSFGEPGSGKEETMKRALGKLPATRSHIPASVDSTVCIFRRYRFSSTCRAPPFRSLCMAILSSSGSKTTHAELSVL